MGNKKIVSDAVIKRLPRYLRYLTELKRNDVLRVSSKELSEKMGLTASQIRQDLSCFGEFGQQGYGYNVEFLYDAINKILGTDKGFNIILIGAGNMGRAISNSDSIRRRGFRIIGIFDIKKELIGTKINDVEVLGFEELQPFIKNNKIDIAALTVPREKTKEVAEKVVSYGVTGLWNFSAMELKLPPNIIVENVHLSDSIMVLGYKINNK
ncbi:MAG: redox-sensing transcriptional repressor Rex [Clostridia bacterium]|nr:redox-sensing transcriptional repressor Rex [Clostridia bacterium]